MKSQDSKEFWKCLNLKPKSKSQNFSKDKLFEFFQNLATDEDTCTTESETNEPPANSELTENVDHILNNKISLEEAKQTLKKLKFEKSAGIDKVIAELLKSLNDRALIVIIKVLNKIFESGEFPEEWAMGIIVPIFKGGAREDLNNYRGITLLSIVGKFFVSILNERLNKFAEKFNIICENQTGFRKSYRTTDHIFTLQAIVEHFLNVKKKLLYVCFVDFKKAFDKVSHLILWKKLISYGVGGRFLDTIWSMYSKVKSCVRSNNGLTKLFSCTRGLCQGCLLSPILFAMFLNDLNEFLLEKTSGVRI